MYLPSIRRQPSISNRTWRRCSKEKTWQWNRYFISLFLFKWWLSISFVCLSLRFWEGRRSTFSSVSSFIFESRQMMNGKWFINIVQLVLHLPTWQRDLQSFTRYLRLTLVFIWNRALREKFIFCFSKVFY